jgi:Transposase DDE domain
MALFLLGSIYYFYQKKESQMYIVQSVLNRLKNINPSIKAYVLSLILSKGRKNCAAMSHSIGVSEKKLYCFLAEAKIHASTIEKELVLLVNETRIKGVLRALVIDPTAIVKHYAEKIEKICHDRTGCTKKVEKVLVPVYAAVIDKNVTIPLKLDFWVQKKIVGTKKYKSKIEIAQALIVAAKEMGFDFDFVALDGAFSYPKMFDFYRKNKRLKFSMRVAKSRVIETRKGIKAQLQNHPALKLHRNAREKTIKAKFNNDDTYYFFTAQKRRTRNDEWEVVYIVSNMKQTAKQHVASYNLRLPIEPMIRTTKQKFGATQCQAIEASKQQAHIMAGFLAYAILNLANNDKQSGSIDSMVNELRDFHFDDLISEIVTHKKCRNHQNIDLAAKKFQNHPRAPQCSADQFSSCRA